MVATPLLIILLILLLILLGYELIVAFLYYIKMSDVNYVNIGVFAILSLVIVIYIMISIPFIGVLVGRLMR